MTTFLEQKAKFTLPHTIHILIHMLSTICEQVVTAHPIPVTIPVTNAFGFLIDNSHKIRYLIKYRNCKHI